MSWIDRARAQAHATINKLPGKLGEVARKANDALGRPLADEAELEDRLSFEAKTAEGAPAPAAKSSEPAREPAPVIVYYVEKQKRDVSKVTDILDANDFRYT